MSCGLPQKPVGEYAWDHGITGPVGNGVPKHFRSTGVGDYADIISMGPLLPEFGTPLRTKSIEILNILDVLGVDGACKGFLWFGRTANGCRKQGQ